MKFMLNNDMHNKNQKANFDKMHSKKHHTFLYNIRKLRIRSSSSSSLGVHIHSFY